MPFKLLAHCVAYKKNQSGCRYFLLCAFGRVGGGGWGD